MLDMISTLIYIEHLFIMKYSVILFEKTCVGLYIQKRCTVCMMLQEDRGGEAESRERTRAGRRSSE